MLKISYGKNWDADGTCYSQTITASRNDFIKICKYLNEKYEDVQQDKARKKHKYDFYTFCYMKNLADTNKKQTKKYTDYFINLTQLSFIMEIIKDKRLLFRNTILRFLYI